MNMQQLDLGLYEVLTSLFDKPDDERKAERKVEAAIQSGHEAAKAGLMTKEDCAQLEARLLKAINDQTWKLVTFVLVANSAMLAIFKHLG